jgi:hypothetical protein
LTARCPTSIAATPFVSRAVTAPLPEPRPLDVASADVVSSPVLITAFVRGAVLAMALAVSVWALGLLPAGLETWVACGCGAALLATGLALVLHGRFLDRRALASLRGDPRLMAGRLQGLMAAALMLKLATVTIGVLVLRSQGVKFQEVAAFAVAFAAASLVCQVTAAGTLVRAMSRAARPAAGAGPTGASQTSIDRPTAGPS